MSCGSWCVYYRDKPSGICENCSDYEGGKRPKFEFGKIDWFQLAKGLAIKEGRVLFFSHSLTTYFTPIEKRCLELIHNKYPDYYVTNPRDIVLEHHWDFNTCMAHLLPEVRQCSLLLFYKDDSHSPGVDMEIAEATRLNIPVREVKL